MGDEDDDEGKEETEVGVISSANKPKDLSDSDKRYVNIYI